MEICVEPVYNWEQYLNVLHVDTLHIAIYWST